MLQHEFESRVGIEVSAEEYRVIDAMYMYGDVEKDEFCRLWAKMNRNRIAAFKTMRKAEEQLNATREQLWGIVWKLRNEASHCEKQFLTIADTLLNAGEKKALEAVGIELLGEPNKYYGGMRFWKTIADVIYEAEEWLKANKVA